MYMSFDRAGRVKRYCNFHRQSIAGVEGDSEPGRRITADEEVIAMQVAVQSLATFRPNEEWHVHDATRNYFSPYLKIAKKVNRRDPSIVMYMRKAVRVKDE